MHAFLPHFPAMLSGSHVLVLPQLSQMRPDVVADCMFAGTYAVLCYLFCRVMARLHARRVAGIYKPIWIAGATVLVTGLAMSLGPLLIAGRISFLLAVWSRVLCAAASLMAAILLWRARPQIIAEAELLFSAAEDQRLQNHAIDGSQMMIEFAMNGSIIRANDNVLRRFGYVQSDLAGRDHSVILAEEDRGSKRQEEFWNNLRLGRFQSGEYRRVGAGGREIWVEVRYNPIFGADGRPVKVVAFATDETHRVTKRIENEIRIRDTEERLRAIVDNVSIGILLVDSKGFIHSINPAAERMFEFKEAEIAGSNIRSLLSEAGRICYERSLVKSNTRHEDGVPDGLQELEGMSKSSRSFPIELVATEVSVRGKRMLVELVRDVTESKQAEQDRARHEEARRKSEEFLDRTGRLAGIGGWELDLVTNELIWSSETKRVFGVEVDYEPSLERMISFYVEDARPVLSDAFESAMSEGSGWDLEQQVLRADGRSAWVRCVGYTEYIDRRPVRLVGAIHDVTARVSEQTALREANDRLTLATESGGIGIWDFDLKRERLVWDRRTYELYGMQEGEDPKALYAAWTTRLHPDDLAGTEQALQDAIATHQPFRTSFRVIWDDGSVHYIQAAGEVTWDAHGRAIRAVGTTWDITERTQAENVLRDQASLLDLSSDSIMVRSFDGEIRFWNHGAEEMYGVAKDAALGRRSHELLGTVFPKPLPAIEAELLEMGRWEGELMHTTGAGKRIVVASRWVLQRDRDKKACSVMEINDNITERKQVEAQLRKSEEKTRLLLRGIKDYAIVMLDLAGLVVTWNEGAESILGYPAEEIIGSSFSKFYTPEAIAQGKPTRELAVATGHGRIEGTGWRLRRDGSRFWANVVITSLHDENGQLNGFVKVTRDITERRNAEAALLKAGALQRTAMQKAEHANRAKSEFLANMSHEIRTPMNAIMGMTYLALRAEPVPAQRTYLTKIGNAAESLLNIINDILDFSKMEAGKLELEHIPFLLSEVMDNVRDVVTQRAQAKKIELSFPRMREATQYLRGDPLRLGQVLINLVSNAVKFTQAGSVAVDVLVKEELEDSVTVQFSVTDTGIGMSAEQVSKLFQSFKQADASVTREYGGTGLGLAISKQICELMHGSLSVESEPGGGSTFLFTAVFDRAAAGPLVVRPELSGSLANKAVLVVDDSEHVRDVLVAILAANGFRASSASSGDQALEALAQASRAGEPVSVVVVDWRMPSMNGLELCEQIRTSAGSARVPAIVLMSAYESDLMMTELARMQIQGFLVKPISEVNLLATMKRVLQAEDSEAGAAGTSSQAVARLAGRGVLLVEDNEINCDLAAELLGDLGIRVTIARNGREGVTRVTEEPFDLVLMDIQMPVMDGLSATKLIRKDERFAALPIIAMTANAMSGDREKSLEAGMNDHLTKPIHPHGLVSTLLRWMPLEQVRKLKPEAAMESHAVSSDLPDHLPPFDLKAALARTLGNSRLLRKMLLSFRDHYAEASDEVRTLLAAGSAEEAQRLVHSLKSVAATLEARDLAEAASALEGALRGGRVEGLESLIHRMEGAQVEAVEAVNLLDPGEESAPEVLVSSSSAGVTSPSADATLPCILVVDDEPGNRDLLAATFVDEYETVCAENGMAALDLAARRRPEVILLDVMMPGIDGFEVCRRLKENIVTTDISVIFITGSGDVTAEKRGLESGAVDYVTKPFNPLAVRARVNNQIKLKRAQENLSLLMAEKHLAALNEEMKRTVEVEHLRRKEIQTKDDFLSHVSHELRSPLAAISSFSSIIADGLAGEMTPQQDEYMKIILRNVAQLQSMVEDLLEATHARTGKLVITPQYVHIPQIVMEVLQTFQSTAEGKGIKLSAQLPKGLLPGYADPIRLRQVLIILVDNALKFTPAGGVVAVEAGLYEEETNTLYVKVADTGCGIEDDKRGSIFERLYQVGEPSDVGRRGLGLGLHIAKELVTRQGGSIWVESEFGEGSQFFFTVPA